VKEIAGPGHRRPFCISEMGVQEITWILAGTKQRIKNEKAQQKSVRWRLHTYGLDFLDLVIRDVVRVLQVKPVLRGCTEIG
jgi:hypothetical protein